MKIIYCDNAATTAVKEEVLKEMLPYFSNEYGNASSLYNLGIKSKQAINNSRNKVAKAINAYSEEIYFTSSGSESDNLAIKGFCYANKKKGNHIITSKIEHPAVLNTCKKLQNQGFNVTYLNVDKYGFVSLEELKKSIDPDTILVTIMSANNEIGTVQNIEEIGKIAKENNVIFHTDAVQAIGNIKIDVQKMNIDMLSMSAHKFYGPKGVGALYVRKGIDFERIQDGGHQEKDKRAGTENVAGIVGLGKAIELASNNLEEYNLKLTRLREYFISEVEKKIGKENIKINGDMKNRLPGNVNISFKNIDSRTILTQLNKNGICASGGSACSSMCSMPSGVLLAIGLDMKWIYGTIRLTFGENNTTEDIEYIIHCLANIINKSE